IGEAFARDYIDASPLPVVDPSLLPWLLKDRQEAIDGTTFWNAAEGKDQHDRQGLTYAQRELRRLQSDLAAEENPNHPPTNRCAILRIMVTQQECAVRFWEGKCYLLDRVIENARKAKGNAP